jgi:hypothetical protein
VDTDTADPELAGRQLLILLEGATVVAGADERPGRRDRRQRLVATLLA